MEQPPHKVPLTWLDRIRMYFYMRKAMRQCRSFMRALMNIGKLPDKEALMQITRLKFKLRDTRNADGTENEFAKMALLFLIKMDVTIRFRQEYQQLLESRLQAAEDEFNTLYATDAPNTITDTL